jgi:hypothetical protein
MRTRYAYVVSGSEDGILGVYGNKKSAIKEAVEYCDFSTITPLKHEDYIREHGDYYVYGSNCSARVEMWAVCK